MKIGIVTYYRSQNYGAQLQTFALQTFLKNNGYDARVSRYWPDYHDLIYKQVFFNRSEFAAKSFHHKVKYLMKTLLLFILARKRHNNAVTFAERKLNLTSERNFDVAIYGSDQIWRKQHKPGCESYNPVYFGVGEVNADKKISYAASMGHIEVSGSDDLSFLKSSLSKFKSLSVRENDLCSLLREKANLDVITVCDPVFLLSAEEWNSILDLKKSDKGKYILLYNLNNIPNVDLKASELAKKTGYKIIKYYWTANHIPVDCNERMTAGPVSFLRDLYNAEYVVTSSFHGVALSVVFGKPFFYSSKPELSNRVTSLLETVTIKSTDMISTGYSDKVIMAVKLYRERSVNWLLSSINQCQS